MSISSQPQTSLDDFLKDITIDLSNTTTVVGAGSNPYIYDTATMSPITITTGGAGTYTIGNISSIDTMSIDSSSFTFNLPEEWIDAFPDWHRVEDMCKKYPGLEIAFRNFQTVYQLVKDDYDNPVPKK